MNTVKDIEIFNSNLKYGLKNRFNNKVIIRECYDEISKIKGTVLYLKVRLDDKWGVVDCRGKEVVKCNYDGVLSYELCKFRMVRKGRCVIVPNPQIYKVIEKNHVSDVYKPKVTKVNLVPEEKPIMVIYKSNDKEERDKDIIWDFNNA